MKLVLAFAIAAAGLTLHAHLRKHLRFGGDQLDYLSIASDLVVTGRFTNGLLDFPRAAADRPSGMFYTPAYPWLVSLVARLDGRLAATARCVSEQGGAAATACRPDLGALVPLQLFLSAGTLLLVFLSARAVSASEPVAWTALVLAAFGSKEYAGYAYLALTESLACLLFAGFSLCLLLAIKHRSPVASAGAGALLGLVSLSRPGYWYLAYALIAALAAAAIICRIRRRHVAPAPWLRLGSVVCVVWAVVAAPWLARNTLEFGVVDFTRGYGGYSLAQRVAYDDMTPAEFGAAWIYWLPDFGDSLARALFSPSAYHRLGWDDSPDTYYSIGNYVIAPQTVKAAGGPDRQVGYILRTMILPRLPKFLLVTLVLAWRGLWIGKYFGLVCFPLLVGTLALQLRRRVFRLAILAAPAVFMLLFQAAVSVSTPRYNLNLIPAFSVAAALCFVGLYRKLRGASTVAAS